MLLADWRNERSGGSVHRLVSPKAWALGAVGLVLMGVMTWLGLWQLHVYDDQQHDAARAALHRPEVPLDSLLGPDDAFPAEGTGRPVTATGTYLRTAQLYVRHLPGASQPYAVVTPLVTATGSAILVVRGAAATPGAAAPAGRVAITGVLEPARDSGRPPNSSRVTDSLSISGLVDSVRPDLYSGYVLLTSSTPHQRPSLAPVAPQLPNPSRWTGIRNLLYACQWWVFAAFVAFMWWRMTTDLEPREPIEV
jgi:cytochrome oxidase assembly protein ShyY1